MKLISIAGARPNFMKIAPLADAIAAHNASSTPFIDHLLVHTGQHYDQKMSELFFRELGIPEPVINLGVGGGPHGPDRRDHEADRTGTPGTPSRFSAGRG